MSGEAAPFRRSDGAPDAHLQGRHALPLRDVVLAGLDGPEEDWPTDEIRDLTAQGSELASGHLLAWMTMVLEGPLRDRDRPTRPGRLPATPSDATAHASSPDDSRPSINVSGQYI